MLVTLRLDTADLELFRAAAIAAGLSLSEWVREAMVERMAEAGGSDGCVRAVTPPVSPRTVDRRAMDRQARLNKTKAGT